MSNPYAALVPAGSGNPYSSLVPQPSLWQRATGAVSNVAHNVASFFENSPAQQIVRRNQAQHKPQPDAFGSVAEAAPDVNAMAADPATHAFIRSGGRSVVPTLLGAGGFGAGAAAGGTITAPAEAIPVAGPLINAGGALLGGLLGAYGANRAASAVQDKAINALPVNIQQTLGQDAATRAADEQQHPYASFAGDLAPSLLTMRPGFSSAPVAEDAPVLTRLLAKPATGAVVGATLGGGQEAAREELSGEGLDPTKLAIASGIGALENRPTALGSKLFNMGGHASFIGMQRAARGAGYAKEAFTGRSDQAARQPFDAEATAKVIPQEQLPPPEAAPPTPANDPYQALVPTAPAAEPAPVAPAAGVAAALPAPVSQSTAPTEGQTVEPQPAAPAPISAGGELGQPQPGSVTVRTPAGTKVQVRPEVVDASTLNKAEGALQNRDRSRDTSALQTQDIISKFDPELLGHDPSSDRGAPIVDENGTVLSGNGRMLALNGIYDDPAHAEKAAAYRQFIEQQGHSTDGIERPVLIRRVAQDMTPEEARQFVVESNKDSKLELSPVERARSDADNVTPEMLAKYAGGDLNSGANSGFVSDFTKSLTAGELGNVIGSDRRLSTPGIERIENAVVAKAYENPKLLEKLMESPHNEIRAITSSLANVAPSWAAMREAAKAGEIGSHYDLTDDLSNAAMRVAEARRRGEKPADILTQQDAFDHMSPATEAMIRAFYNPEMTRPASVKSVTQFLRDYIDEASAQKSTEGLFGEEPGKDPHDILNDLLRQRDDPNGASLFDAAPGKEIGSNDRQGKTAGLEGGHHDRGEEAQGESQVGAAREGSQGQNAAEARPAEEVAADRAADGTPAEHAIGGEQRPEPAGRGLGSPDAGGSGRQSGLGPLEDRSAYTKTHAGGATTDRPSDLRSAVEHLGMKWDDFNLKAPTTQVTLLQRAIMDKLGIQVTVDRGELGPQRGAVPYRVAIDQMLDGFHNITGMAAVLGLPPKAMSLNGTLTLELRKRAKFYGAFYPGEGKIALPGRSNSFAHEWGHALDYYLLGELSSGDGKGMSGLVRKSGTKSIGSPEIAARFSDLMNSMFFDKSALATKIMELEAKAAAAKSDAVREQMQRQIERIKEGAGQHRTGRSDYYTAARKADGPVGEPGAAYWQSPTEMMARAFEAYVAHKAEAAGMSTEVISHADADYLSNADERLAQTFPKGEERQAIFDSFDGLFGAVRDGQQLGKGEAAEIPNNPERREDVTPERVNAFRRIVKAELRAHADAARTKEKAADQPKDPKGWAQKANDVRHFFYSGGAAEIRALARRWNSKAIMELHDRLVSEPGRGNRLQKRDLVTAQRLRGNRYSNSIEKALNDYGPKSWGENATVLSKQQAEDLHRLMTNEDAEALPLDARLKTLASRLREISDGIWHDLRNTGFDLGYTRNGFLPRMYDRAKAQADQSGFLQQARQVYEDAGLEPDQARAAAAKWYFRLVEHMGPGWDASQPHGDFLKGRALPPSADALMHKYMVNEPIDLMRRYAEGAAHRIEWAKRFGVDNQHLNSLFDRMGREGVDRRDMATLKTMTDIMSGNNPMRQKNPTLNAVGSAINTIYGTVKLLGRAVFQHIAEPIVAGVALENPKYGVQAFVHNIAGIIGTATAKERREIAEFIGLMRTGNTSRIMAERFGGTYDDAPNWQKIDAKLFYNTGLTKLTEHKMAHGQSVINAYLQTLSNKLLRAKEGDADAREVLTRFNELGIRDPIPFARWMTGLHGKLPSKADLAEGFDEAGKAPWAYDWITATKRLSARITQEPHPLSKSLFSHSGVVGRLMTGILAFHYAQYDTISKPIFKRAYERIKDGRPSAATKGVAMAIAGLATLYIGYFGTTALRVYLTDRERWREEEAKGTLLQYLAERTATTFMGDPLDPLVQAISGLKYNRDLTANLPGPAAGNIMSDASKVAKLFAANSRHTNTAEHNALQGAYGLLVPWASAAVGSVPGGPILSAGQGVAQGYLTSQQAGNDFASGIVGQKNGRVNADGSVTQGGPTAYDLFMDKHFPQQRQSRDVLRH